MGATVPGSPIVSSSSMAALLARGYTRLPSLNPLKTKSYAEEFTEWSATERWASISAKTTWQTPAATVAGGFRHSTDGSDVGIMRGYVATNTAPLIVALDEVTPWWIAFVFRVPTPGAGTWNLMALRGPGALSGVHVGYYTPVSTTKFVGYTYNGTAEDDTLSTVSVDGGIHTGEVWFDGVAYYLSFDNEPRVLMNHTHLFSSLAVAPAWVYAGSPSLPNDIFARAAIWPVSYSV